VATTSRHDQEKGRRGKKGRKRGKAATGAASHRGGATRARSIDQMTTSTLLFSLHDTASSLRRITHTAILSSPWTPLSRSWSSCEAVETLDVVVEPPWRREESLIAGGSAAVKGRRGRRRSSSAAWCTGRM
jgi:hypothetical protein